MYKKCVTEDRLDWWSNFENNILLLIFSYNNVDNFKRLIKKENQKICLDLSGKHYAAHKE